MGVEAVLADGLWAAVDDGFAAHVLQVVTRQLDGQLLHSSTALGQPQQRHVAPPVAPRHHHIVEADQPQPTHQTTDAGRLTHRGVADDASESVALDDAVDVVDQGGLECAADRLGCAAEGDCVVWGEGGGIVTVAADEGQQGAAEDVGGQGQAGQEARGRST